MDKNLKKKWLVNRARTSLVKRPTEPSKIKDVGTGPVHSKGKHIIWHAKNNSERKPSLPKMPWDSK